MIDIIIITQVSWSSDTHTHETFGHAPGHLIRKLLQITGLKRLRFIL